jgi:hypothetical protein
VNFALNKIGGINTFLIEDATTFNQKYPNNPRLATINNLAKQYVLHYPINQNSDVYTQIEKNEGGQFDKLISEFEKAYVNFSTLWKK